jgi:hypothetical protein
MRVGRRLPMNCDGLPRPRRQSYDHSRTVAGSVTAKKMPTAVMMIGSTSGNSSIIWISRMMRSFDRQYPRLGLMPACYSTAEASRTELPRRKMTFHQVRSASHDARIEPGYRGQFDRCRIELPFDVRLSVPHAAEPAPQSVLALGVTAISVCKGPLSGSMRLGEIDVPLSSLFAIFQQSANY